VKSSIGWIDGSIILLYLVGIVGLGCWIGLRHRRRGGESRDYFLAGGTLTWPVIGLALFSTNISTIHLVSLAQEGYKNGLVFGNFELMAGFTLILLALFFAPFYIRSRVATLPDFLEKRYSRASRDWLAFVSILSAIFLHIGFTLYTAALVMHGLLGIPREYILYTIIVIAGLTALYTAIGGLIAVVTTEAIQTIVLLLGAFCVTVIAYGEVGGWSGVAETLSKATITDADNNEIPATIQLSMLRSGTDPGGLPWYAVMLGYPIIGIWYWCTDQTIVQRVLGAKSEDHARVGALFAGFIKILPVFILVFPGLICFTLVQQAEFGYTETGELVQPKTSGDAYAFMIQHLMPVGLRGVVAAALLAAAMSTVSGALNSVATLFSYDLFKRWAPNMSDHKLVVVGRVVTIIGMVVAVAWSPFIEQFESIFGIMATMICYLAPPITATFVLGVFWKRASSKGSIVTLVAGFFLGIFAFFLNQSNNENFASLHGFNDAMTQLLGGGKFAGLIVQMHWMVASFWLCMLCMVIHVVVSLLTPEELTKERANLVWDNPLSALGSPGWSGLGNYKVLTALLLIFLVATYYLLA
jgi:SSS family solute:Na+ symporter